MSQATETPTQTLEQALNRTDIGHYLYENRKIFILIVVLFLVSASGWVIYKEYKVKTQSGTAQVVYEFNQEVWEETKKNKIDLKDFLTKFQALSPEALKSANMWLLSMEMTSWLADNKGLVEASVILETLLSQKLPTNIEFVLVMQYQSIKSKMNELTKVLPYMEKLAKQKDLLIPAKVYLDLGRLYQKNNQPTEAKVQFNYVLTQYPSDEYAKLAKLYLTEIP